MFARLLLAMVVVVTLNTGSASAQRSRIPPQEIWQLVDCISERMADAMTDSAGFEEIEDGWRVVVPLRGQPNANRDVQSPPPVQDTLAWYDVYAVADESELPADFEPFGDWAMVTPSGVVWIGRPGGYFWLRTQTTTTDCFQQMNGARRLFR